MSRTRSNVDVDYYGWPYDKDGRFCGWHKSKSRWYRKFHRKQIRQRDRSELNKDTEDKVFHRFRKNFWYYYW